MQATLELMERKPSHVALADALRRRILLGGYQVGARLPTERDLAAALGVGRATAREAIRTLAAEGLVQTRLGRSGGTVVTAPAPPARQRRHVAAQVAAQLDDLMRYRIAVEPLAARLAAERAGTALRRQLAAVAATESTDLPSYHRLDSRLHLLIAEMSGHQLLAESIANAREEMFRQGNTLWLLQADGSGVVRGGPAAVDSAVADPPVADPPVADTSVADPPVADTAFTGFRGAHADLVAAVVARDPDAADAAMTNHLNQSRSQFAELIGGLDKTPLSRRKDHR